MQYTKWIPLKEFSGFIVSETGLIAKIIKPYPNRKGYLRQMIRPEGSLNVTYIHRLIAETFIPNPDNKKTVNHKNRNVQDNRVSNLEWMTNDENLTHKHTTKRADTVVPELWGNELWMWLAKFEDYIVSDLGRIAKIIKAKPNDKGYLKVKFSTPNGRVDRYVQRLVAASWLENPYNLETVNHKNHDRSDNSVGNLEWMSRSDNTKHSFLNPKQRVMPDRKGEKHHNSKLTTASVIEIRAKRAIGIPMNVLADFYNVSDSLINLIDKRKAWKHV